MGVDNFSRKTTIGDPLIVSIPAINAAASGLITDVETKHVFGCNLDADSTEEDVWFNDGILVWQQAAAVMDLVSTSADDDGSPLGIGAHTVKIEGLDASFDELEETVTLNGVGTVSTSGSFIRINRASIVGCGNYTSPWNVGDITIRVTGGGDIQAKIAATRGVTQKSHYTIPNNKIALVTRFNISVDSTKTARFLFWSRVAADDVSTPFGCRTIVHDANGISGPAQEILLAPKFVAAKTDLWWSVIATANNTAVEVDYDLVVTSLA